MLHCMNSLDVFLQVAVVVECHATLITHDVFGLQMNFVNMLTKVGVFSFAVGTLGLTHKVISYFGKGLLVFILIMNLCEVFTIMNL